MALSSDGLLQISLDGRKSASPAMLPVKGVPHYPFYVPTASQMSQNCSALAFCNKSGAACAAGERAGRLKRLGQVKCVSFSRNGRLLGVGCEDGGIHVLDWETAATLKSMQCGLPSSLPHVQGSWGDRRLCISILEAGILTDAV